MNPVRLTGRLICASDVQAELVGRHLPLHVELTRAEPGCITFDVATTDDPLVWAVDELFRDDIAFAEHQDRVASSEWGRVTSEIERRYAVDR